jgi:hypothetical protein
MIVNTYGCSDVIRRKSIGVEASGGVSTAPGTSGPGGEEGGPQSGGLRTVGRGHHRRQVPVPRGDHEAG